MRTGHYASYVLSNRHGKASERKWLFCSDEDVLAATEAEVLRSKAYMLCVRVDSVLRVS